MDRKTAKSNCRHVEVLLTGKMSGESLARAVVAWLPTVVDVLKAKLATAGLTDAP